MTARCQCLDLACYRGDAAVERRARERPGAGRMDFEPAMEEAGRAAGVASAERAGDRGVDAIAEAFRIIAAPAAGLHACGPGDAAVAGAIGGHGHDPLVEGRADAATSRDYSLLVRGMARQALAPGWRP